MSDPEKTGEYQPNEFKCPGVDTPSEVPERIGRYRIERIIGKGGFGVVFLAQDEQLGRSVAVKVPHATLISRPEDAEAYLAEARTVASLDHPHIVPVYDAGSTAGCPCYVVSKYVQGANLATTLKQRRLHYREAAELVAIVADALHYAHKQGVVHRDVKPGNILISNDGKPYVVDFGLALREENVGKGSRFAGTFAYMSPEQARGEGHRVDGRSDVFSLGVVLYELLAGRQPFRGDTRTELLEQVASYEARPLRQYDEKLPKELDRICNKAMSKRASERYSSAHDMAEDLRHFLRDQTAIQSGTPPDWRTSADSETHAIQPESTELGSNAASSASTAKGSVNQAVMIVPKGLRSFDSHDADFFLELLPGPRDREGLPDSLRFWKSRIEETDPDNTFSVGLIYGPSGCGKSSLVKAGLLPRLSDDVVTVFIEATPEETESRIVQGLRKRCPSLDDNLGLKESLAALRRGQGVHVGKKVLIVLDQFEQWLHAKYEENNTELVQALRQCEASRVQCIVLVRDDFWLAVSRFLRDLEIRLLEGHNIALADLFDLDHANKILTAFGRAFGRLPNDIAETSKEQKEFLKQAVAGLSEGGKIVCVRLALFAEMMKGKPWTPATLKEVGGTTGVGVTFLEDTFSSSTASPEHRYHQKAARAVLKVLLPEAGTDIKGQMKSYEELLEASGYAGRAKDFEDLIHLLDGELRLITPTDPEGIEAEGDPNIQAGTGHKYYQLTHDYLVQSLREWLTRKQKETRRGRAELLLADRATVWNGRSENRQLPSLVQWFQIRWFTEKLHWTSPQRKMMAKAGQYHALRGFVIGVFLAAATCAGFMIRNHVEEKQNATYAAGIVQRLLDADTAQLPGVIEAMSKYRKWTDPLLREQYDTLDSRKKLHSSLALLPVDPGQLDFLTDRLLDAAPHEVIVIRDAIAPHKNVLNERLWGVVTAPARGKESQRLRAAAALAMFDPNSDRWTNIQDLIASDLVSVPAVHLQWWMKSLDPVGTKLLVPLSNIFRDRRSERASEGLLAANLLADYSADNPQLLADLLMDAGDRQFRIIFPKFVEQGDPGVALLIAEVNKVLSPEIPSSDERREILAKRQANAAVALLRMKYSEKVWPLFKHSGDPRLRSYLIHRLAPMGAEAEALINRLEDEEDPTVRRALLLSLGEFIGQELGFDVQTTLLPRLQMIYRNDADPGIHGAVEWLLRIWKQDQWLKKLNEEWAQDKKHAELNLKSLKRLEKDEKPETMTQWYVNGQGQTMVVIPGPVEFVMGSPTTEKYHPEQAVQHKRRIGRSFAIAAKSVTLAQYRSLTNDPHAIEEKLTRDPDLPVVGVTWKMAAKYCNLLSKAEDIPEDQWCFEFDEKRQVTHLRANYLHLTGYRLPTEAEMEYATRAGATSSRFYGETEELLGRYAWYWDSSSDLPWPVGTKKPNDLGLFDVLGNCSTWCVEPYGNYPTAEADNPVEDEEGSPIVVETDSRVMRGGSYYAIATFVRSSWRQGGIPTQNNNSFGFRPARTWLPPQ